MEKNILDELILSEDLSIMEERLKKLDISEVYSSRINDHCMFLDSYLIGENRSISIKLSDIYHYISNRCENELSCGFDICSFNVALFEILNDNPEFVRLKYFEDDGWVVLMIKGHCAWSKLI